MTAKWLAVFAAALVPGILVGTSGAPSAAAAVATCESGSREGHCLPTCPAAESPSWDPSPGYVVLDSKSAPELGEAPDARRADDPHRDPVAGARRTAECAERIALGDAGVQRALSLRPGSQLELRFEPAEGRWVAWVHERGGGRNLARVEVDDSSGEILESDALSPAEYPTRLTSRSAIDAAVDDGQVQRVARRYGGTRTMSAVANLRNGCCWEVDLFRAGEREPSLRVDVDDGAASVTGIWTGIQLEWNMARGDRDAFGGDVNHPWIWLSSFVLFALVVIDWRRLRSRWTLDAIALLSLGVSHEAFQRGEIEWSVPLAVPPLLWLFVRMGWQFVRPVPPPREPLEPRTRTGRLASRTVPTSLLVVFCVLVAGLRIGLNLEGTNVIDVGYAGVAGARLELDGRSPWGNMPDDNQRGDTYGPLAYLAYVPAVVLLDDDGGDESWESALPAAHAMSIVGDLGAALALLVIGWRWYSRRAGVLLAAAWLTCPWTLWALGSNVNDQLMASIMLAAFAALPRPVLRGGLMTIAAAIKFAPIVALLPMLHCGGERRRRQALLTLLGAAIIAAACWAWVAHYPGGTPHFLERTIRFQADRDSPFSIWGLYGWQTERRVAEVLLALLLLTSVFVPRVRDVRQVAAGIAAAIIGVQLIMMHWFYLYVPWFLGFVLIVLVSVRFEQVQRVVTPDRGRGERRVRRARTTQNQRIIDG